MKKGLILLFLMLLAAGMCGCTAETADTAATEETQAAAETIEVVFIFGDNTYKTVCEIGKIPEVPEFEKTYKSGGTLYTFAGWKTELVPASKDDATGSVIYYIANVTKEKVGCTVTFSVDGQVVDTQTVQSGELASAPAATPTKAGMSNFMWVDIGKAIKEDTTIYGLFYNTDTTAMQLALAAEPLYYAGDYNDNRGNALEAASAMVILLEEERANHNDALVNRILGHLRNLISGGNEPFFDAEPYWNYPILCAAIDLCKNTPAVWGELTQDEKDRLDCIMEAFLYICSFCTDDDNDYGTGPRLRGNYRKNWNPNYRLANVTQIVFLKDYFGGTAAVNSMLANFDYDAIIAKFQKYGFKNAYESWTTQGLKKEDGTYTRGAKELLSEGGQVYILEDNVISPKGTGVGVRANGTYTYLGHTLDDTDGILLELLEYCYSGGKVVNSCIKDGKTYAYILDGTDSPVLGLDGMMFEFDTTDGNGVRSSCSYTSHDFLMVTSCLTAAKDLGIFDLSKYPEMLKKTIVGNTDTVYKLDHGYYSYSLGKGYNSYAADRGNGYLMWAAYWKSLNLSAK